MIDLGSIASLYAHGHELPYCPRCDAWQVLPLGKWVSHGMGSMRLPLRVRSRDCGGVGQLQVRPSVPTHSGSVGRMAHVIRQFGHPFRLEFLRFVGRLSQHVGRLGALYDQQPRLEHARSAVRCRYVGLSGLRRTLQRRAAPTTIKASTSGPTAPPPCDELFDGRLTVTMT